MIWFLILYFLVTGMYDLFVFPSPLSFPDNANAKIFF